MPPHHRAFTDSLESRQRTAHESTFPSSSTHLGAHRATTSSIQSTASSALAPVLATAAQMTAPEAEARDEVQQPPTSHTSSRFHSQATSTCDGSNDDRSALGAPPSPLQSLSHDPLGSRSDRTPRPHSPFSASASASAAGLDPDQHWLSEDEARGVYASTTRRGFTLHQARLHRGEARDRLGAGRTTPVDREIGHRAAPDSAISDEHKNPSDFTAFASNIPRGHHSIHHRPSTISQPTNRASPTPACSTIDPPLTRLLPKLLSLVTCPACQRLFHDPTTLLCGHTVCLKCSRPTVHRLVDSAILVASSTVSSSESLFTRNPTNPTLGPGISGAPRHPAYVVTEAPHGTSMETGSSGHGRDGLRAVPGIHRGRLRCAQKDCKVSKEQLGTASEARPDFVLQKVLHLLRSYFPLVDHQFEVARIELAELDELADAEQTSADGYDHLGDDTSSSERRFDEILVPERGCASSRSPSGSSISSGGGGEDPTSLDMKRASQVKPWASFTRARRRHAGSGEMKDRDQPAAIAARIELDLDQASSTFLVDVLSELECQICFQLLHDPITSQCGHTFCQKCLVRSYDHSDKCPLCRRDFPSSVRFRSQPINSTTQRIILSLFPSLAADRFAQIQAEERRADGGLDTPLFVCTLAWPNLPTYIHIFEPRYRLMIRRAMEGNREFGMVLPSRDQGGINEYGTMLKIQSCNMIEDGRSIIETVGTYRFRIFEKGVLDGYTVGRIERVYDIPQDQEAQLERQALARNTQSTATSLTMAGPRQIERSTSELMEICLEFVSTLRNGSAPWVLQRLNNTIGPMPTTPADFSFWMAEVMPVDDQNKALLLQITSPRERLRLLVFWIEQFRSSWWFSRGCTLM